MAGCSNANYILELQLGVSRWNLIHPPDQIHSNTIRLWPNSTANMSPCRSYVALKAFLLSMFIYCSGCNSIATCRKLESAFEIYNMSRIRLHHFHIPKFGSVPNASISHDRTHCCHSWQWQQLIRARRSKLPPCVAKYWLRRLWSIHIVLGLYRIELQVEGEWRFSSSCCMVQKRRKSAGSAYAGFSFQPSVRKEFFVTSRLRIWDGDVSAGTYLLLVYIFASTPGIKPPLSKRRDEI